MAWYLSRRHHVRPLLSIALLLCTSLVLIGVKYSDMIEWWSSPLSLELLVPNSHKIKQAIVLGKTKHEKVNWTYKMLPEWVPFVYSVENDPAFKLHVPRNRGREAMPYLTFIIDHYDKLPEITAFVHGTDRQWHNDDISSYTSRILKRLRLETVRKQGYVNLRCRTDPGCNPTAINPHNPTEIDILNNDVRVKFLDIYMHLFRMENATEVPQELGGVCCAQFVVTRERILQRPLEDYVRMRQWILEEKSLSEFEIGWVFEKIWHVIFGQEGVFACATSMANAEHPRLEPILGGYELNYLVVFELRAP
ncbi:hypothetical protein PAAG_04948 [Paracoccidioides lutzii Pb01]|uniref:Uncharacterized protein n=1 Tax=Paracoccidioides lutzii (strain ATCC MYA-826 / Pb01) TaxID=502779 RepID=C1H212_PARBA|nr:hypothetical protein PAAG_04948 [Paracoccidioides lutzii Pb01]EEH33899.1 hypothetical protein PAAG_04948 [Paracoccidioides lutzii Pb01]